jgi:DNA-binding transcriptional MerR regulator
MGDNLWKLFGYNFTKSQLRPALKNMTDVKKYFREVEGYEFRPLKADGSKKTLEDALQEIAGIQVRDVYPNYSMIPTFVLNVRKFPLAGNFVAFVSEMYRNSFQILRRGLREMQSSNPYLQQIGARRLLGYTTTVGVALPMMKKMGQIATEIPDKVLDAYASRFAPEFEKGHTMVPVEAQDEKTKAWKSTDMSTMVPYADILTPFKTGMQTIITGKNPDQTSLDLYTRAFTDFIKRTLEPFLAPSIAAETALELIPKNGQFRTKQGGLIADIRNDDDWWSKVMYHAYKKLTPTTIRSGEEIAQAIGGDLSKAGIKRDLYDTVLKVLTGFGIRRQDPYQGFRFKLGRYSKELGNAKAAFTTDVTNARNIQRDVRLVERNLPPQYFASEFDKLNSNKYRIQSEIYKDIQALRDIGFSEKEIKDMMKGRRAVSKDDIRSIMLGLYNPENVPEFRKDSGVRKAVEQINRELETDYKISDFINKDELRAIKAKYKNIPLGLSESERIEYLRTTTEKKLEDIRIPRIEERFKTIEDQQGAIPQTPIPNVPMPNVLPVTASVDPTTNLTRTETALLSPEEQVIAQRSRGGGIMDLV